MNYPVWELTTLGGGFLIALISVIHVYIAHFAVGGGLFLVLTERKAYAENSSAMLEYTKKHAKFFLLLTMVAGGVTGVGIWFIISLLSPAGTSILIHNFVFAWATEWVFFLAEIVALFIYYYTFNRLDKEKHLLIGWLYFAFAWLSLFVINGVIDFMLAPGNWLNTHNFWDGFFNPLFWPSLFFRTFIAFILASLFGLVTATFLKDSTARQKMVRYCVKWLPIPFLLMLVCAYWYFNSIPDAPREIVLNVSPELARYLDWFLYLTPVVFLVALFLAIKLPGSVQRVVSLALLLIGLMYMGSFEFIREGARRPFVIYDVLYSNSILKANAEEINKKGLLKTAKWIKYKQITPENELEVGQKIFQLLCASCHSIGGPLNDILPLTKKFNSVFGLDSQLNGLGKINNYMPLFFGTHQERWALARYIVEELHGGEDKQLAQKPKELPYEIPPYDQEKDEYVLLAWNNLGMHCISDSDPYWILLPPANDLYAQLIRRGELPEIVTEGVELRYQVQAGFENPSKHVRFWEFSKSLVGKELPLNIGVSGNGLSGSMKLEEDLGAFVADLVPVVPYPDDGSFNPYPLFTIEAVDKKTGKVLATTRIVAPTSTEMGCKNCHGGKWRVAGVAGFTAETALDILKVHDRINKTNLFEKAKKGQPMLCQSCHPDPVLGTKGKPGIPNFPAAIHGWHANYLTDRGPEACFNCHPSSPTGPTECLRGVHKQVGLDCTSCHGYLEDHALSLLLHEQKQGKKVDKLMRYLKPRNVATVEEINPRIPWLNEPDCLNCHQDFQKPASKNVSGFNTWTKDANELYRLRTDQAGLMCESCHGATHANYPARNLFGRNRDNIPPLQYQGTNLPIGANKNCKLCHTIDMEDEGHHENMLRNFRNMQLISTGK
jgi:mono/diheme cytochrome c family protein